MCMFRLLKGLRQTDFEKNEQKQGILRALFFAAALQDFRYNLQTQGFSIVSDG